MKAADFSVPIRFRTTGRVHGPDFVLGHVRLLLLLMVATWNVAIGEVIVPSSIGSDTIWSAAESPYVLQGDVTVEVGATLTIQPGVVVKAYPACSLYVKGALIAQGIADGPVVFTSLNDDSDDHDTNGDGGGSVPAWGDWGGISFSDTCADSVLSHVIVRYGGREYSFPLYPAVPAVEVRSSNILISECVIVENNSYGIGVTGASRTMEVSNCGIGRNLGSGIHLDSASPTITGSVITENGGASAGSGIALRSSSNPDIRDNKIADNAHWAISTDASSSGANIQGNELAGPKAGIFVLAGELVVDTTWASDSAYVVNYYADSSTMHLTIAEGATLRIEPGVVVKFEKNARIGVRGDLTAQSTADERIVFTSLQDDSHGGDTNGDGDATSPAKNDWGDLIFWDTCAGSILDHVEVRYAGQTWSDPSTVRLPAIIGLTSNLTISHSEVSNNGQDGISIRLGSPTIQDTRINSNEGSGIDLRAASPTITRNTISGNSVGIAHALDSAGTVYLNDFLNNASHVSGQSSSILWWSPALLPYPYGGLYRMNHLGNHWDDYTGADSNGDGIGDTPYIFQSGQDEYPLVVSAMSYANGGGGGHEPTLPERAAALARSVIGADYVWGAKGWENGRFLDAGEIHAVDCSGLVFWSYNKASGATEYQPCFEKDGMVEFPNPIAFEGANNQYHYNVEAVAKEELLAGDLLFFDADIRTPEGELIDHGQDGRVDHVAMYVGGFSHEGADCNIVEATVPRVKATTVEEVVDRICAWSGEDAFKGFARVIDVSISLREAQTIPGLNIMADCPVDLIVADPEAFEVTADKREVPDMIYLQLNADGDSDVEDVVLALKRKVGEYSIRVIPKTDALPTDIFSLTVMADGKTITLAHEAPIETIPSQPYVIRSNGDEIVPVFPATIDLRPDTLNLKSKGRSVTACVRLPAGFDVCDIDVSTVRLNDVVPGRAKFGKMRELLGLKCVTWAIEETDEDLAQDLTNLTRGLAKRRRRVLVVQFDRQAVCALLSPGEQTIEVSGRLKDGTLFAGTDTIKVIDGFKWSDFWSRAEQGETTTSDSPETPSQTPNKPPVANAGSDIRILSANQAATVIRGTATDPDGDALQFRWLDADYLLLGWLEVGAGGDASVALGPLDALAIGDHSLTLEVTDGHLIDADSMVLTVENTPPKVQAAKEPQSATVDIDPIVLTANVSDFDGDTLQYQWLKGSEVIAAGTIVTPQGGETVPLPEIVLPPGDSRFPVGRHNVTVKVCDGVNNPVSASVTVRVVRRFSWR
jgi:parallel beta-helix repeat protein